MGYWTSCGEPGVAVIQATSNGTNGDGFPRHVAHQRAPRLRVTTHDVEGNSQIQEETQR